jgi:hypothetical protein|tara:strand:+ start:1188 stop:1358 length:171 start_codon:yes stop_codon:yes gene_type:complete
MRSQKRSKKRSNNDKLDTEIENSSKIKWEELAIILEEHYHAISEFQKEIKQSKGKK